MFTDDLIIRDNQGMDFRGLARKLGVIGPAVLISVQLFDPASIVTATAAGASSGFGILWAALYSGILLMVVQEVSARLGIVTGKTLAENFHQKYGKTYSFLLFIGAIFLDFATLTAEVMGLSLALSFILGISYALAVVFSIVLIAFLGYVGSYDTLEKVIIFFVTVIFLAYLYFLFELHIPLQDLVFNSVVPSFNHGSFYYAEAIFGASIMPTYVILHSGLVYEKG